MKKFASTIFAFTLLFSMVADVQSEVLIEDYLKLKDTKQIEMYLQGYLDGLKWANGLLRNTQRTALFCEPDKLSLNVSNLKQIVDVHYEKKSWQYQAQKEIYFGTVGLFALAEAFPCK